MRKLHFLSLLLLPLILHGETPNLPPEKELKALATDTQTNPSVENTGEVPTNNELKKLTLDSLLLFNAAIQTKNFENFYGKIAKLWQKQTNPEELFRAFKAFVEMGMNLAPIAKLQPAFEGIPGGNKGGLLVIKGSYPTQPNKVFFELKYIDEDGSWKLFGINVNVKPADDKADKKVKEKKTQDADDENADDEKTDDGKSDDDEE